MRKAYPDICHQCGDVIAEGVLAVRKSAGRGLALFHPECAGATYRVWRQHFPETPCKGCGRPLLVPHGEPVCSARCYEKARRDALLTARACAQCGQSFTPKRKDARFCSTRCRVANHRRTSE